TIDDPERITGGADAGLAPDHAVGRAADGARALDDGDSGYAGGEDIGGRGDAAPADEGVGADDGDDVSDRAAGLLSGGGGDDLLQLDDAACDREVDGDFAAIGDGRILRHGGVSDPREAHRLGTGGDAADDVDAIVGGGGAQAGTDDDDRCAGDRQAAGGVDDGAAYDTCRLRGGVWRDGRREDETERDADGARSDAPYRTTHGCLGRWVGVTRCFAGTGRGEQTLAAA